MMTAVRLSSVACALALAAYVVSTPARTALAQSAAPQMLDPRLDVRTVVSGFAMPIGIAFLDRDDMLVLEKDTGRVKRIANGLVTTVLDLGVNNNSERGLLGIALHPDFPANPGVYLYWTCRSSSVPSDQFFPAEQSCLDATMFAADSGNILEVPCTGQSRGPVHLDRIGADLRSQRNHAACFSERRRARSAGFSELNRVLPGFNSGWVQIMGPPDRLEQFKTIETTTTPVPPDPFAPTYFGLQQLRWSPEKIADRQREALRRLVMFPGAHYSEPEFSWKYEVAPGAIGFVEGRALGRQFEGDLFMAAARPFLEGGHLFRLKLTDNRRRIRVDDPRLRDRVADNLHKWEITESETLLIGRNFGIGTDMQTGPNGHLYVVSLTNGAIYEIFRARSSE